MSIDIQKIIIVSQPESVIRSASGDWIVETLVTRGELAL